MNKEVLKLVQAACAAKREIAYLEQVIKDCRDIARTELKCDPKEFNAYMKACIEALG